MILSLWSSEAPGNVFPPVPWQRPKYSPGVVVIKWPERKTPGVGSSIVKAAWIWGAEEGDHGTFPALSRPPWSWVEGPSPHHEGLSPVSSSASAAATEAEALGGVKRRSPRSLVWSSTPVSNDNRERKPGPNWKWRDLQDQILLRHTDFQNPDASHQDCIPETWMNQPHPCRSGRLLPFNSLLVVCSL